MIRSLIFSIVCTILIVFGVGYWVNGWFLQGFNWLWIAIPAFILSYKLFGRIFRILDIVVLVGIIILIICLSQHGGVIPSL